MRIRRNYILFYNDNGFKDFNILTDSLYPVSEDRVALLIRIEEGKQYFLRDVDWVGNSVYRKEDLEKVFNVKKGLYIISHLYLTGLMVQQVLRML